MRMGQMIYEKVLGFLRLRSEINFRHIAFSNIEMIIDAHC